MAAFWEQMGRFFGLAPGADEAKVTTAQLAAGDVGFSDVLLARQFGSKAGAAVDWFSALQVSTVMACVRVIAEGIAQPPLKVFRPNGSGGREEARNHPLWPLLYRRPNGLQTSFEFRETLAYHAALTGNAFALKIRNSRGQVIELLPCEPGITTVQTRTDMSLLYQFRFVNGSLVTATEADVLHVRGPSWTGRMGMDAVNLARNTIGLAVASEEFGSELYANGARPSGILTTEQTLNADVAGQIRQAWTETHTGTGNRMKTAILHGGLKWEQISVNANEAQFIETRRFIVEEICRFFRVNPIKVMSQMNNMAYASVEQLNIAHINDTLGPWHERFEQRMEMALLTEAEMAAGYQIEIVDQVLTRGTQLDRANTNAVLRQNGVITGNEFREAMDLPRVNDAALETFTPAAHLYGPQQAANPSEGE